MAELARVPKDVTTEHLQGVTDEVLLDYADDIRGQMSYFNAAEGSYRSETAARNQCSSHMKAVFNELKTRDLTARPGNFLC